jgi:universal stress protein A
MPMGNPADEIVQLARDEEASLIVLGTHGRTGFSRLLMGSVAEVVVRRSPCPVLVYRPPIEKLSAGQPVLAPA